MAHASKAASAGAAETCRCWPPLPRSSALRLSAVECAPVRKHKQTCSLPNISELNKTQSGLFEDGNQDNDQNLCSQKRELATMLEPLSPVERSEKTAGNDSTPKLRPQYTASAPSAPGTPSPVKTSTRQDSSYFSASGDIDGGGYGPALDANVQARQIRARERVTKLRGKVLKTREAKRVHNDDLRRLRDGVRDATNKLMKKLNETEAFGEIGEALAPYYTALREAQDAFGPVDDAHDRFEDKLDEEEQDLEQVEDNFYRNYEALAPSILKSESQPDAQTSPVILPHVPLETGFPSSTLEGGLIQEYLRAVSSADHIRGQLEDLEESRSRGLNDISFGDRHNLPVSAEASHSLAQYKTTRSTFLTNLRKIEDELFGLREQCLEQKLFSNHEHIYEPHDAFYEGLMDSVDEALDRSPLRMAANYANFNDREVDYDNKRQYVNNWLLQWVQDSTYEWLALKTWIYLAYPDTPDKERDLADDKWSELALENWDKDSAGLDTNKLYDESMRDVIVSSSGELHTTLFSKPGLYGFTGPDTDLNTTNRGPGRGRNGTPARSMDGESTPKKKKHLAAYQPRLRSLSTPKVANTTYSLKIAHQSV